MQCNFIKRFMCYCNFSFCSVLPQDKKFFDCSKQFLKWLLQPSTHPSIHPSPTLPDYTFLLFLSNKQSITMYDYILFCYLYLNAVIDGCKRYSSHTCSRLGSFQSKQVHWCKMFPCSPISKSEVGCNCGEGFTFFFVVLWWAYISSCVFACVLRTNIFISQATPTKQNGKEPTLCRTHLLFEYAMQW